VEKQLNKIELPPKENLDNKENKDNTVEKKVEEKEVKKISKEDMQYKKYFLLAKNYFDKKDFLTAKKNINTAKKYKKTLELYELAEKIQNELNKFEIEKRNKKKEKRLKKVSLLKLKSDLLKSYIGKISMVRINVTKNVSFFKNRVKINGQLSVKLKINEKGELSFQDINDQYLYITPSISKKRILRGIWLKFKSIKFSPPIDKEGNKVILEKWRVSFIVSKFKNKIILRKV
jgi:hypothetical protein